MRHPKRAAGGSLDFALRLAFFAIAPFGLVVAATLLPITGALLSVGVALAVCVFGEALRTRLETSRWLRLVLRRQLEFQAYYRDNPPKAFVYYVFYPLLFPYWIFQPEARREFFLYKGVNLVGIVILVGTTLYRYVRLWRPELDVRDFLPVFGLTVLFESFVVLAFLMPIATSVVALHQTKQLGRLMVLLGVSAVALGVAAVPLLRRHDRIVSLETRSRVFLRTERNLPHARGVILDALRAAWRVQTTSQTRVEGDGKVEGPALEIARATLLHHYREDEAAAFDVWASPRRNPRVMVLYTEGRRGHDPIWVGLKDGTEVIRDPRALPKGAFREMRHAER